MSRAYIKARSFHVIDADSTRTAKVRYDKAFNMFMVRGAEIIRVYGKHSDAFVPSTEYAFHPWELAFK